MLLIISLIVIIIIIIITLYITHVEDKSKIIGFLKACLSVLIVFFGVFWGQYTANSQNQIRENLHTVKLLKVSLKELHNFTTLVKSFPSNYSASQKKIQDYTPVKFVKHNPIELPFILNTTITDTNIIRTMHPLSISSIMASIENLNTFLSALKGKDITEDNLHNIINFIAEHSVKLEGYIKHEINYQSEHLTEKELTDIYKTLSITQETEPVGVLVN